MHKVLTSEKEEKELPPIILQVSNTTEEISNYQSISDLLQDEQMFRLDQDPPVFGLNSEDLNNNNNNSYIPIMDFQNILSDDYISQPEEIEMFNYLNFCEDNFEIDKEKEEENSTPSSPIPAIAPITLPPLQRVIVQPIEMMAPKQEEAVKLESQDEFDLIKYINSHDVSINNFSFLI